MPTGETNIVVSAERLETFCRETLIRAGLDEPGAKIVAQALVETELRGVSTHGVVRFPMYARRVQAGLIRPSPQMRLERTGPGTALLFGGHGAGQVVGQRAMAEAVGLAREAGIGCVAVTESHHFGAAFWFAMQALEHDMIGLAVSHADTGAGVTPFGAARGYLGSNPICVAIPTGSCDPILLDMATSVVSVGWVQAAAAVGQSIPLGWAVDAEGNPTTDPAKAEEGALLPLGGSRGFKGFGLGLVAEVLSALLTGSPVGPHIPLIFELTEVQNLGHFMAALDIRRFVDPARFRARMDDMIQEIKALPLAPGAEEILLPGEPEARSRRQRLREGIPLPPYIWAGLREWGFQEGDG
jgi:LDH2 family malate/lactate/ureidoglycolate dehydrogenase